MVGRSVGRSISMARKKRPPCGSMKRECLHLRQIVKKMGRHAWMMDQGSLCPELGRGGLCLNQRKQTPLSVSKGVFSKLRHRIRQNYGNNYYTKNRKKIFQALPTELAIQPSATKLSLTECSNNYESNLSNPLISNGRAVPSDSTLSSTSSIITNNSGNSLVFYLAITSTSDIPN